MSTERLDSVSRGAGRLTLLQAVQRDLAIVLAPIVALLVVALAIGLARSPTYTSEARLNVGGFDLNTQSIPGYTVAIQVLATAYSRAIDATPIVEPAARATGVNRQYVLSHVVATPIENSSVIRVDAQSTDAGRAQRLADVTADSMIAYGAALNRNNPDAPRIRARYIAASRALQAATAQLARASGPARDAAQTRVDLARLEQETAGALYQQTQAGQAQSTLIQKLAPASAPTNDRSSVLQQLIAAALIAGVLIGVGLAFWRAELAARRRLAPRA